MLCTGAEALIELSLYYYTAVAALLPISARLADTFSLNTCLTSTFLSSLIIQPYPHSVGLFLRPPLTLPALVFTLGHALLIVPESLQVNLSALCPLAHGQMQRRFLWLLCGRQFDRSSAETILISSEGDWGIKLVLTMIGLQAAS